MSAMSVVQSPQTAAICARGGEPLGGVGYLAPAVALAAVDVTARAKEGTSQRPMRLRRGVTALWRVRQSVRAITASIHFGTLFLSGSYENSSTRGWEREGKHLTG